MMDGDFALLEAPKTVQEHTYGKNGCRYWKARERSGAAGVNDYSGEGAYMDGLPYNPFSY